MLRRLFFDDLYSRAAFARDVHSRWLTRAIRKGRGLPRIPTRRVQDGGFGLIMSTPDGRRWADSFWSGVFETLDEH